MITLGLDTSFHFLSLVLMKDNKVIASVQKEALKQQSETILSELDNLFKSVNLKPSDLNQIVISKGPGSYTGLRIAMSIAKIIGSIANIQVYTLSSLQLLAGLEENVSILIDARAERVYFARYDKGLAVIKDGIYTLEEAKEYIQESDIVYGHLHLLNMDDKWPNYISHYLDLKDHWENVNDLDHLSPSYFKEHDAYKQNL